ncbi:MAG TPA: hypothetical protein VGD63_07895 [Steroidobacteraceae bacterium]
MAHITLTNSPMGPLITVAILPSSPRQAALRAAGLAVPAYTSGTFLVDTGASNTVVDMTLISPLGLAATGAAMCHTPSTGQQAMPFNQYDVMIWIPGASASDPAWIIEALPVMECDLSAQGIKGLIGRDVLDRSILIYNGTAKHFSLAY